MMGLWLLYLQITIASLGLVTTVWLFMQTGRDALVLKQTGKNGPKWVLVTSDLIDEFLRLAKHSLLLSWSLWIWSILAPRGLPYVFGWGGGGVMLLTALIVGGSLNRWRTRRLLLAYLNELKR